MMNSLSLPFPTNSNVFLNEAMPALMRRENRAALFLLPRQRAIHRPFFWAFRENVDHGMEAVA